MPSSTKNLETAVLGGGCFWCLEAAFSRLKGVFSVVSGYSGGTSSNPTYEEVSTSNTGHAETVQIEFDPKIISYEELLHIFFSLHDPTTPNRQGNDIGSQYRSIIFFASDSQLKTAQKIIAELEKERVYNEPIITEVVPLNKFYPAEQYHQKYFEKNPEKTYCQIVIEPKLQKMKEKYSQYYK